MQIRNDCVDRKIPFTFKQTGANFIKDNKLYRIERKKQMAQTRKANIDFFP